MANEINEPRALTAALAGPAFTTRGGGVAMHVANRHVERWAPEAGADRVRPLRSQGFVDRLIAPWLETAQRSASMRLFSQYRTEGLGERAPSNVSWVFPRPWYQDELDWMTAARQAPAMTGQVAPTLFTTRGTYVPPAAAPQSAAALPAALYEYIAPSLSLASPGPQPAGVGYGGDSPSHSQLYTSLVPFAAVQAAETMSRAVSPALVAPTARMTPALRSMLSAMLNRAATTRTAEPSRLSMQMPELVTPPAPRPVFDAGSLASSGAQTAAADLAERYAEQRAQIANIQRIARHSAERELVARSEAAQAERAVPDVRDIAQRAEAELRQRTTIARSEQSNRDNARRAEAQTEQARQLEADRARHVEAVAADRTRQNERVVTTQRLHEQARIEAATHARSSTEVPSPSVEQASSVHQEARRAPAEVATAIAALPPELAAFIGQRPERAMQAINELNEALRTVELLARGAASGVTVEPTRGPRLMMPSGLGGLVAAVDRASVIADHPMALTGPRASAPVAAGPSRMAATSTRSPIVMSATTSATRVPTMSWMTAPTARVAPSNALEATAAASPAALSHVAWADRWLARFAGASKQSLDTLALAAGPTRLQALADAAPGSVFVSPMFESERVGDTPRIDAAGRVAAGPNATEVMRFADDAETPDDVFAAISAAASRGRIAAHVATTAPVATPHDVAAPFERATAADAVAHAAPSAPGAGFAAQLASSPFAPALRHLLPLPAAVSFDVRALFGSGITASYLAGLLDPEAHELSIGARLEPSWATWSTPLTSAAGVDGVSSEPREVPAWDATYVAPDALAAHDAGAPAQGGEPIRTEHLDHGALAAAAAPLTTLRTALLSWDVDAEHGSPLAAAAAPTTIATSTSSPISTATARSMIEAMSLPLLGDAAPDSGSPTAWTAPGMIADRAHSWSVAQERSTTDLALDFVTPELVLAARVYGLGPAEAAQAARLALAGPGNLSAMAGAVDRTFVQAMAIEADRRERSTAVRETIGTAYPSDGGDVIAATTRRSMSDRASDATLDTSGGPSAFSPTGMAFGVDRKPPRGAYLWPAATIAALGLHAAAPDGQQSMSVAALELLAAQSVAELGTYAALGDASYDIAGDATEGSTSEVIGAASGAVGASMRQVIAARDERSVAGASSTEPAEHEVLGAAATLVPSARRARFDALYVALSQSPTARNWSPAARAARALALAGRGEDGPVSARERAATAWDVLPVVYADSHAEDGADREPVTASTGTFEAATAAGRRPAGMPFASGRRRDTGGGDHVEPFVSVDARPGLGALTARAGEALGAYVTPTGSSSVSSVSSSGSTTGASTREPGALLRVPTAAQELVQTGRPAGRHGGGEVEIPSWFETAARKMLDDRSGASDGISLAELTLVTAAPASHVAASTRSAPAAAAPAAPAINGPAAQAAGAPQIDIEKVANEIYRHILVLMDVARGRNGEPYL